MIRRLLLRVVAHLDGPLMAMLALLLLVSVATVFSASGENGGRVIDHLLNMGVALTAMLLIFAGANLLFPLAGVIGAVTVSLVKRIRSDRR